MGKNRPVKGDTMWFNMAYYYSLYYIPVFSLVKGLQIIMRISARTKYFSYLSRSMIVFVMSIRGTHVRFSAVSRMNFKSAVSF